MTMRLIFGALFVLVFTVLITWAIRRWADAAVTRQQAERARLDRFRQMSPEAPRAAGLRGSHRRVS